MRHRQDQGRTHRLCRWDGGIPAQASRGDLRQILQDPNPSTSKHHAVEVSFLDIAEHNMIMATLFAHHPMEVQLHFDDAVVEAQNRLLESMAPGAAV